MIILFCNTGTKYNNWWTNNLYYMLKNSGINYKEIHGITEGEGEVYDKLKLFKEFKDDEQYIYFDLDGIIKGDITHLLRDDFTLLHAWWRPPMHTPLNSSIMSWRGDYSHIHTKFHEDEDYSRVKYWKGIDEYIYKEIEHNTYDKVCWSYRFNQTEMNYPVCLFNQSHKRIKESSWTSKYLLSE